MSCTAAQVASVAPAPPRATGPGVYRPRRPAATLLHRTVREHLETYLAGGGHDAGQAPYVPGYVRTSFENYLKCGILAHGFARVYCAGCGHDFLVAFSCKGRDICPSCATRRMVETGARMVDEVLPRVQFRQWVLSVPKRVRWHMREKPQVTSGLLTVFLRAVETTIRQRSPGAPPTARFGAVAFVHRFGGYLNSHVHFHVLVTDGVFSADGDGGAAFHPAVDLAAADFEAVQRRPRLRILRVRQFQVAVEHAEQIEAHGHRGEQVTPQAIFIQHLVAFPMVEAVLCGGARVLSQEVRTGLTRQIRRNAASDGTGWSASLRPHGLGANRQLVRRARCLNSVVSGSCGTRSTFSRQLWSWSFSVRSVMGVPLLVNFQCALCIRILASVHP